jgi:hypothetical protein
MDRLVVYRVNGKKIQRRFSMIHLNTRTKSAQQRHKADTR